MSDAQRARRHFLTRTTARREAPSSPRKDPQPRAPFSLPGQENASQAVRNATRVRPPVPRVLLEEWAWRGRDSHGSGHRNSRSFASSELFPRALLSDYPSGRARRTHSRVISPGKQANAPETTSSNYRASGRAQGLLGRGSGAPAQPCAILAHARNATGSINPAQPQLLSITRKRRPGAALTAHPLLENNLLFIWAEYTCSARTAL
ncbi:hypothetical protein NDU88_007179 [Pleurodeles waltl]|uniref:Uncharacterized protein n=1 Tax=Pleurodeles waltl TaxID=8319 RepID=A0AAV7P051_PLEWA|nr:hypothetical protein NDU88_007179 [Pleurodeles waltl]